jgi:hypothetical protein
MESNHVLSFMFSFSPCKGHFGRISLQTNKRMSKFLNLMKTWRKNIKKCMQTQSLKAQRRQREFPLLCNAVCFIADWDTAQVSKGEPALMPGRPNGTPGAQKHWKTSIKQEK